MENLLVSFNILAPIMLLMGSGMLLRHLNILDAPAVSKLNAAVFRFFLPIMMFQNVRHSSLEAVNIRLPLFLALAVAIAFGLAFLIVPKIEKENSRRGVIIQGAVRSNFAVFGTAVAGAFCNKDELGIISIAAAVVLTVYGALSTVALSVYSEKGKTISVKKILLDIAKNPLVLGCVLGLFALFVKIKFPGFVESALNSVTAATSPVSFIGLGAFLTKDVFTGRGKSLFYGVFGKLVLLPLIFLPICAALGFRGAELAVCLAVFASPTATASFPMAQQMGGDGKLAAGQVAVSCVFSFLTMFLLITLLRAVNFL